MTLDQQTAADGEGGTPRSCAKHATARLHTRIRQRSSKRRRVLPKSFGSRRIRSGSRHVHLALACASRKELRKLRHLTKWAGAAVRMGQQGGQTEALWTHLDPSKPQERLHAPAGADARSAATCHNHTEQEASDHLHLQLKTTFSVKTTFRKEKKRGRIIKRSALLLSMCPMKAIPRCSLGGAGYSTELQKIITHCRPAPRPRIVA